VTPPQDDDVVDVCERGGDLVVLHSCFQFLKCITAARSCET
jgi:hypothetical protein